MEHHLDRLAVDHLKAKEIAECLKAQPYVEKVEPTETNIVIFYLNEEIPEERFMNLLMQNQIKISSMGQGKLRIVTHLDYTAEMHQVFLKTLKELRL